MNARQRFMPLVRAALCVAAFTQSTHFSSADGYFTGLGGFPGGGSTRAVGVSGDGSVVVGTDSLDERGFVWTRDTGLVPFANLPGGVPLARLGGVSGDGMSIVGTAAATGGAFRWTADDGATPIGLLPGGTFTLGNAASADGLTVVGYGNSANGRAEAYRWIEDTGLTSIGDLPGGTFNSGATDVSADGRVVVGGSDSANGGEAFRWTVATGMVGLGSLSGGQFGSNAYAISADGTTIVGVTGSGAFRWTVAEGMVALPNLPNSLGGYATGVSGDGSIIVGIASTGIPGGEEEAWIWDAQNGTRSVKQVLSDIGLRDSIAGFFLFRAVDVSADGRTIVGHGGTNAGNESWVATLPEPASISLLAVAFPGILWALRKRRSR